MNIEALMFSVLFFTIFALDLFMAIYVLHLNSKAALNRSFAGLCATLGLWSLGVSLTVNAPDAYLAALWHRFSQVGNVMTYVLILHFILNLAGCTRLKKLHPFLYIPGGALAACSFLLPLPEYDMVKAGFGWTPSAYSFLWERFFYGYSIVYLAASLFLVGRWKHKTADKAARRQASLILVSFLAVLLISAATDVAIPALYRPAMPQLAPLAILITVAVFFYLILRYGLMSPDPMFGFHKIMTVKTRTALFYVLAVIFFTTGLLSFVYEYFFVRNTPVSHTVMNAALLILIGLLFYLNQRSRSHYFQYALNTLLILLSIPAISLPYINNSGAISWAFPVILMIAALVFNKRSMLIMVTAAAIFVQLLIWLYTDSTFSHMSPHNYAARIFFYVAVFLIGLFINSIYVSKLRENAGQIELQKMIADISYNFAHVNRSNIDDNIGNLLEKLGLYYLADRCFIFLFDREQDLIHFKYEWCLPGVDPEIDTFNPCSINKYQSFISKMSGNMPLYFDDVGKLQPDWIASSDFLINKSVTSLLSAPLESGGTVYGFLGFASGRGPMNVSGVSLEILQTFANLIADKLKMIKAEENIEYLAYYDQLTGLPNRVLFSDRVTQAIHLASRQSKLLGIVYIDLNGFNNINDTFGHGIGDAILKEVAGSLNCHVRKTDTVARLGGDDFLVLLNDISDVDAISKIADSLMRLFYTPVRLNDQEFFVTASAGIAVYPVDGEDSETLVKHADLAMYKAKIPGFNRFVLCTADMKDEVRRNMMLSNSLYRSLERGELSVHYQPQIHLGSETVIGVEALLRWNHAELGLISPTVFIPLAEKNGLIGVIGEWVLKTACIQNKKWQDMGYPHRRISVNLSVVQLRNPCLPEIISGILQETGLPPGDLELEITESAAVGESAAQVNALRALKALGISIAIDDFGTEYSSLNRLRELPIDRLKIDMQFVQALDNSEKDQAIAVSIINLAKNLGLQVVAEGVETALQLEFLRSRQCDEVQGYYYFRPMPPEEIERVLF